MIYIISYKFGTSDEIKLAQIEAESVSEATVKATDIFNELEAVNRRRHKIVDIVQLNEIRKLDVFE